MEKVNNMKKILTALTLLSASFTAQAKWVHVEKIDLMTDEDTSFIGTNDGNRKFVGFKCDSSSIKGYSIILKFDYLGESNDIYVRFDKNDPFVVYGVESTNGTSIFINPDYNEKLLAGFKAKNKVAFQTTDFRGTKKQAVYDLKGFSAQLAKMKCVK